MSDDYIKKALLETVRQLTEVYAQDEALQKQRLELRRQSFALLTKAHSLAALCDDLPPDSLVAKLVRRIEKSGLTESVRNILAGTGEWMTPIQIRDYLIRFRIDLARYKNPAGSIHTILGRLVENGQVEQQEDEKTGKTVFRWKQPEFVEFDETVTPESVAEVMIEPRKRKRSSKKKEVD